MLGGFLGAGKTTAIARLAKSLMQQGLNVGIVTNDQAEGLVDTDLLRSQGFDVGEVAGACFCCKFDDLMTTVKELATPIVDAQSKESRQRPDVVLTEPVGSCTDLIATVIEPICHYFEADYTVAPLAVLLKPEHGTRIFSPPSQAKTTKGGFSPQAEYIFLKQIEEAEIVAINKVDKIGVEKAQEIASQISKKHPSKKIILLSGKTGIGFEQLLNWLQTENHQKRAAIEVDYEVYALGEAELGWLNGSVELTATTNAQEASQTFPLDEVVAFVLSTYQKDLAKQGLEPAHVKTLLQTDDRLAVANLVASESEAELSVASNSRCEQGLLLFNARVAADPALLQSLFENVIVRTANKFSLSTKILQIQAFRPGKPEPTHRMD